MSYYVSAVEPGMAWQRASERAFAASWNSVSQIAMERLPKYVQIVRARNGAVIHFYVFHIIKTEGQLVSSESEAATGTRPAFHGRLEARDGSTGPVGGDASRWQGGGHPARLAAG